jgi:hypothetical protein
MLLVLLLATLWPPLQMEIRLTPSAPSAPTKTKNLTDDFAARRVTVAAFAVAPRRLAQMCCVSVIL